MNNKKKLNSDSKSTFNLSPPLSLADPTVEVIYFRDSNGMQQSKQSSVKQNEQPHQFYSRAPVFCPIKNCKHPLRSREVMSHFFNMHKIEVTHTQPQQKTTLVVNDADFIYNQTICLGVLAYKGLHQFSSFTTESPSNISLPSCLKAYADHLPVLILGRRTNIVDLLYETKTDGSFDSLRTPVERKANNDIVLIWFTTVPVGVTVYGEVAASNLNSAAFYGMTLKVKPLKTVEEEQVQFREADCLRLSYGWLKQLTNSFKNSFKLEMCLFDHEP